MLTALVSILTTVTPIDHSTGEAIRTDVLRYNSSNDTWEVVDEVASEDGLRQVGDVVIAPAVAARNNPDDPAAELRLLLVHGILHLAGFEHEGVPRARARLMRTEQERLLGLLHERAPR